MGGSAGVTDSVQAKRVILCGSMSFMPTMARISEMFARKGIEAVMPDVDPDDLSEFGTPEQYNAYKKKASLAHFAKIRDPRTTGIVVANFEKRGIRSYVGPNTFAEIAVAFADGKDVFMVDGIPEAYADELEAWGVVDLVGSIAPVLGSLGVDE